MGNMGRYCPACLLSASRSSSLPELMQYRCYCYPGFTLPESMNHAVLSQAALITSSEAIMFFKLSISMSLMRPAWQIASRREEPKDHKSCKEKGGRRDTIITKSKLTSAQAPEFYKVHAQMDDESSLKLAPHALLTALFDVGFRDLIVCW